jgi:hypothetical protein
MVVHHRDGHNAQPLLVTLCIRCHVRLHHSLRFRRWVPNALLGLWRELHPGVPLQLQLLSYCERHRSLMFGRKGNRRSLRHRNRS